MKVLNLLDRNATDIDDHHRVAAKKVTMLSAVDRPLRCMVLFWLFVVLVLLLVLVLDRSWDCTISARSMRWTKEDRTHGLRDEAMRSVHRVEDRKAAMPSSRSITRTSTVRHSGLSTSTMGSCGRDGQNKCINAVSRTIATWTPVDDSDDR